MTSDRAADRLVARLTAHPVAKRFRFPLADHTKEFKGTDEELQAIIDWLRTLEART